MLDLVVANQLWLTHDVVYADGFQSVSVLETDSKFEHVDISKIEPITEFARISQHISSGADEIYTINLKERGRSVLNKRCVFEVLGGTTVVITGLIIEFWADRLYWIQVFPPPLVKQILDALPGILWIFGIMIIADGLWHHLALRRAVNMRFTTSLIAGLALTFCSALYWSEIHWADFYHINYGAPFPWMTRILSTIAGPVDHFKIDLPMLIMNIIFWFIVSCSALWLYGRTRALRLEG